MSEEKGELFSFDLEGDGLLPELTQLWCGVFANLSMTKWRIFVDADKLPDGWQEKVESQLEGDVRWMPLNRQSFQEWLHSGEANAIACHNLFGYDLPALKQLGFIDNYDLNPDRVDNLDIKIFDTLAISRQLHPDRRLPYGCPKRMHNEVTGKSQAVGSHGLAAWGFRVCNAKPSVDDWRNLPLHTYTHRCIEDVKIGVGVWKALMFEASEQAIGSEASWGKSLKLANQSFMAMCNQELDGVPFHADKAEKLLVRVDKEMEDIRAFVEPQLPERVLPQSQQPNKPKTCFKKDGSISTVGYRWAEKLGYDVDLSVTTAPKRPSKPFKSDGSISSAGKTFCLASGLTEPTEAQMKEYLVEVMASPIPTTKPLRDEDIEPFLEDVRSGKSPVMTAPMKISNQDDLKKWLVNEGWRPTMWGTRDFTVNSSKEARTEEEQEELLVAYMEKLSGSPYKGFVIKELGINPKNLTSQKVLDALKKKARYVPSTPQLRDLNGNLCTNLEVINGELASKVVRWLSLRNRRTIIKGLDESKGTGWLNNPRLEVDGRLPAGCSGLANTSRLKHRTVVNVPKAEDSVVLGKEMRELFYAPKGALMLGADADALEARVAGWYADSVGGDGGAYYRAVSGEDGFDYHSEQAVAYTKAAGSKVTRSQGKNITYAVLYGATAPKIAKMLDIDMKAGKAIIQAFWKKNWGLKNVKDDLELYWETTDKKYIRGADGRKVYTRSKHSLLNCLFQSAGAIVMDTTLEKVRIKVRDENLRGQRILFVHDEVEYIFPEADCEKLIFDTQKEAEAHDDGRNWSQPFEKDGKFIKSYSRIGEIICESMVEAGKELGSPVEMTASYDVGIDWSEVH